MLIPLGMIACAAHPHPSHLNKLDVQAAIHCLNQFAPQNGLRPPQYTAGEYRVRYIYGKVASVDRVNELHLAVYGPHGRITTLFEVYLSYQGNHLNVYFGDATTFKRLNDRMETDEIPGGQATLNRVESLYAAITLTPAIDIRKDAVATANVSCVFEN